MNVAQQDWIGDLPHGWHITSLRDVLIERKELNKLRQETNILSVTNDRGVINYRDKGNIGNKASDDIERYKRVYKGDIVANSMNVIIGSVGISPEDGVLSPVYIVMRPTNDVDTRFYDYIFKAKGFQAQLKRIGYGILDHRMRIPWDNLKMQQLPKPDLKTQQKIADFLDTETAQIDNLIAKQERLLELLEEKRRATITHAVTRGLNPSVELKETNFPWLGQIPEHWNVNPLFKYVRENKRSNKGMVNENVLTLSYGKIKEKNLDNGGLMPESFETYQIVKPGDIVLRLTDLQNDKTSLRVGHSSFEGIITSAYVDISSASYKSKYLYYLLHAYDLMKVFYNLGAGLRQGMKFSDLKRLPAFGVEQDEQQQIIDYLESYERKTDELKQKIQTQITLLRERRTSLISHVVTGKVMI